MIVKNLEYEILTPDGFKDFSGIQKISRPASLKIHTTHGTIQCSLNHAIKTPTGFVEAQNLKTDTKILPDATIIDIEYIEGEIELYDALDVGYEYEYITNGFISHNCAFLGSSATLISAAKLLTMVSYEPIQQTNSTRLYAQPEKDHIYAITVDVAEGLGGDFSVIMIFDVTAAPYKPVFIYQDRYIDPMALPGLIFETGKRYNDAMVLVESNFGQMVADILWRDFQYEHVIFTERAVKIPGGFKVGWGSKQQRPGIQMNTLAKRIGCSNLKSLIENDQLIINDEHTIEELRRFAVKGKSYAAENGNDDLCMALVLFGWLSEQGYLKDQNDVNVRGKIAQLNQRRIDDNMLAAYRMDGTEGMNSAPLAVSSKNDNWLLKDNDPEPDSNILLDISNWERHGW
jgi:Terminase RNaseH-like domain